MTNVFIVSGIRTAVGKFGGAFKDTPPIEIATAVTREAIRRAGIKPDYVQHVVFGQCGHTEPRDAYLPRVVALNADIPISSPAFAVNRLCGSGLQAVISAAQSIMLGDTDIVVAGGVEVMSRIPYTIPTARFGARMNNAVLVDNMVGLLTDPFQSIHMGVTAENVAKRFGITRNDQDDVAYESHRRAAVAISEGRFKDQILGVQVKQGRKKVLFDQDEHVRLDVTREDFDDLKPIFQREDGTVTAGNASGINDAAASVVLASEKAVKEWGLKPLARLASYAHAGVEPDFMGIGPVPASRAALARASISVNDLGVIESNEAFAAQACAVTKELGLDPSRVNPNGSGISLGHPIGCTGAMNTVKLVHEMRRTNSRYGLVTMCIGGGQGIAAVLELV